CGHSSDWFSNCNDLSICLCVRSVFSSRKSFGISYWLEIRVGSNYRGRYYCYIHSSRWLFSGSMDRLFSSFGYVTWRGITCYSCLFYVGGISGLNASMGEVDTSYLSIWGKDYVYYGQWGVILGSSLIYMIGYMGLPHVVVRHMSMKSTKTVKTATLWT